MGKILRSAEMDERVKFYTKYSHIENISEFNTAEIIKYLSGFSMYVGEKMNDLIWIVYEERSRDVLYACLPHLIQADAYDIAATLIDNEYNAKFQLLNMCKRHLEKAAEIANADLDNLLTWDMKKFVLPSFKYTIRRPWK